jgi:hypothetical protein
MKIVINSNKNFTIALDKLMDSFRNLKEFKDFEFIICIGGFYELPTYNLEHNENITYIKCNHNSIDFTGLITLLELLPNEIGHFFYLHDTCVVGENFLKYLQKTDLNGITTMCIVRQSSMNIGIYSFDILLKFNDFLLNNKNTDDTKVQYFKNKGVDDEDHIFKNDDNNKIYRNQGKPSYVKFKRYYGGAVRKIEHYKKIDLYKIKANWLRKTEYQMNI